MLDIHYFLKQFIVIIAIFPHKAKRQPLQKKPDTDLISTIPPPESASAIIDTPPPCHRKATAFSIFASGSNVEAVGAGRLFVYSSC